MTTDIQNGPANGLAAAGLRTESMGTVTPTGEFGVARAATIGYALATNDPVQAHLDGVLAPPVFGVTPVLAGLTSTLRDIAPDGLFAGLVHGAHDFRFNRPLRPGETVTGRRALVGVRRRRSGVAAILVAEVRDTAGALVNEQWMTAYFRTDGGPDDPTRRMAATTTLDAGRSAPAHPFPDALRARQPVAVVTQRVDADQAIRYAAASGDDNPIHLDREHAIAVGLPGAVLPGLCTMAFASHALLGAVASSTPAELRRLAARFSRPLLPGQDITTQIWRAGRRGRVTQYAFEISDAAGMTVVKDGLAELGVG